MIKKSAKPEKVGRLLDHLNAADNFMCAATLTNVLTKRGDDWAMHLVGEIRAFRRMCEEARDR